MAHADLNMTSTKKLKFVWLRRLIGDYVGVPVMHLFEDCAVNSVDESVKSLEKRLKGGGCSNFEIGLVAHSLGGPVCYRYLKKFKSRSIKCVLTVGSMNHMANPNCGLDVGGTPRVLLGNNGPSPQKNTQSVDKNTNNNASPTNKRGSFDNSGYFKKWTNFSTGPEPFFPVRVPHLDVLDAADFLAFPFYKTSPDETTLVEGDASHRTFWLTESWMPWVFAHTGYYWAESFYENVVNFLSS